MATPPDVVNVYIDAISWIADRRSLEPALEKLRGVLRTIASCGAIDLTSADGERLRAFYLARPDILVDDTALLRALALDLHERGLDCEVMVADLCNQIDDMRAHSRSFAFRGAADAVERRIGDVRQCFP